MSFWKNRSVLVTGCTGFLGTWLTEELVTRGASVVGLVRDWRPEAPFFATQLHDRIATVRGGLEDHALLERVMSEYEVDTVFHLAAQAIVGVANKFPRATFEANIMGTWNVLEAARMHRTSRVIVASSDKAYGDHPVLPYSENAPLQGRHPYDVSKSCADLISRAYYHTYKMRVVITRCGNLFGPGDLNFSRLVPSTIRSALMGERPVIRSDGTPKRDYVYVHDIVNAYLALAEQMDHSAVAGQAFNLGSGEPLSVLELVRIILREAGRTDLEPLVLGEAKGEIQDQYLDSSVARAVLGWSPAAPVADRIRDAISWYREHLLAESAAVAAK